MGVIAERLAALDVTAVSPDGDIKARLAGRSRLRIAIRPGAYPNYRTGDLEHQLAALLTALWRARQDEYARIVTAEGMRVLTPQEIADDERRRFAVERERSRFTGTGAKDHVSVAAFGMRQWRVRVRDGAVATLSPAEFETELLSAVAALMADARARLAELKAGAPAG